MTAALDELEVAAAAFKEKLEKQREMEKEIDRLQRIYSKEAADLACKIADVEDRLHQPLHTHDIEALNDDLANVEVG